VNRKARAGSGRRMGASSAANSALVYDGGYCQRRGHGAVRTLQFAPAGADASVSGMGVARLSRHSAVADRRARKSKSESRQSGSIWNVEVGFSTRLRTLTSTLGLSSNRSRLRPEAQPEGARWAPSAPAPSGPSLALSLPKGRGRTGPRDPLLLAFYEKYTKWWAVW
jgi:hypothetical protein